MKTTDTQQRHCKSPDDFNEIVAKKLTTRPLELTSSGPVQVR